MFQIALGILKVSSCNFIALFVVYSVLCIVMICHACIFLISWIEGMQTWHLEQPKVS